MTIFNINDPILVQITETGWKHLEKTVGRDYINTCIKFHLVIRDNKEWYKLQMHQVFSLLGDTLNSNPSGINSNIILL